jgi:RNA polymerase sigma factor (sigma-70 family)
VNQQTDSQLLRAYAENRTEEAFAELVRRYVDFTYSAALRMVRDRHLAEDVTQGVFVALAKSAPQLTDRPVLSGWLHRTAQNIAAQTVRTIERRRAREQEAVVMNELLSSQSETSWEAVAPHLDAALGELNDADRDALLLRYFEKKSATEMAGILGVSSEAAQKRVSRAVERLREFFSKRNVTIGASGLVALISANAVQSAPVGLAAVISAAAVVGTTVTTSTAIAITKTIAMTTLQKTFITVTVAALAGAGIYQSRQAAKARAEVQELQQQQAASNGQIQKLQSDGDDASNKLIALQNQNQGLKTNVAALTRSNAGQQTAANVGVSQQPTADVLSSTNSQAGSIELPKNSWANAGFSTPEFALKTRGWSVLTGNREVFAESLSITPGARKILEDMILQLAQASNDPNKIQLIQQAINEKWGVEEAILMPMMALNQRQGFAGYRIVSEQSPAPDQMIMDVETEMTSGPAHSDTLKFQQIGGDWKVVIDEGTLRMGH